MSLEEHKYTHFNRALGVKVEGKAHYEKLMKDGGYVSFEKGEELASKSGKNKAKPYDGLSKEATSFLREVRGMADSRGNIKISDRFVEGLKKHGVHIGSIDKVKDLSTEKGGFKR